MFCLDVMQFMGCCFYTFFNAESQSTCFALCKKTADDISEEENLIREKEVIYAYYTLAIMIKI